MSTNLWQVRYTCSGSTKGQLCEGCSEQMFYSETLQHLYLCTRNAFASWLPFIFSCQRKAGRTCSCTICTDTSNLSNLKKKNLYIRLQRGLLNKGVKECRDRWNLLTNEAPEWAAFPAGTESNVTDLRGGGYTSSYPTYPLKSKVDTVRTDAAAPHTGFCCGVKSEEFSMFLCASQVPQKWPLAF